MQLTNEPIEAPRMALAEALKARDIAADRFRAIRPSEAWEIPGVGT